MQKRKLGRLGLEVSALGLGCMGMSDFYGVRDEQDGIATIQRALDLGVNFFDTSDMYGPFTNEELLGKALRGRRTDAIIATKFGIVRSNEPGPNGSWAPITGICGSPAYVKKACDASLKRLGIDYIDLYYQHRVDDTVPIEDTIGALADLVQAGKIRFVGLSEAAPATIRRAHAVHPLSALQTEYSLWSREPEDTILPTLRELGIGFVPYSPLGRGFLTGQLQRFEDFPADDYRRNSPRFQGDNFTRNLQLVDQVVAMAAQKQVTPSQLALAWVLAQGDDIVPIPGTKQIHYLEENIQAASLSFSDDALQAIAASIPRGAVSGARYPASMQAFINR